MYLLASQESSGREHAPLRGPAALDVARADDHVVGLELLQELRDLARVVGEVGVHLEHVGVPARIGQGLAEGGHHRRAAPALRLAVQELHPAGMPRHLAAHRVAGAVRAAVVGHPDVDVAAEGQQLADEGDDVLALVVRRHDHEGALGQGASL